VKAPNKEIRQLLRAAKKAGLTVERRGSKHFLVTNPRTGETTTIAGSPGSPRAVRDYQQRVRKLGSA